MSEVFNPGEPLDITKLNEMYDKLIKNETTITGIQDATKTATNWKITTGTMPQKITPKTTEQVAVINYGTTYRSIPTIFVTPYGLAENSKARLFYSIGGSYSTTSANLRYWTDDAKYAGGEIGFFWVAIGLPQI